MTKLSPTEINVYEYQFEAYMPGLLHVHLPDIETREFSIWLDHSLTPLLDGYNDSEGCSNSAAH